MTDPENPRPDPLLARLVAAADSNSTSPITVWVSGVMLTGELCSPAAYYSAAAHVAESLSGTGARDLANSLREEANEAGAVGLRDVDRGILHLRNAQAMVADHLRPLGAHGPVRIRLESVDAWMPGQLGVS